MSDLKIMIAGSNGFIGKNLEEYFRANYANVLTPKRQELNLLDGKAVQEYMSTHRPDVVINCAVTLESVEMNLKMYYNMERCSKDFGRFISIGSGAEYDMQNYVPEMKEDFFGENVPSDIYGLSKYIMGKDMDMVPRNMYNLRVFGIYGIHENHKRRFITNNICKALTNNGISMFQNMNFDYLYIDDLKKILEIFIHRDPKHRSYNVCTGQKVDLLSLAKMIQEVDGKGQEITIKEEGLKPEYTGDNSRFIEEFGPFEFTPHKTAIEFLYDWYKNPENVTLDPKDFA